MAWEGSRKYQLRQPIGGVSARPNGPAPWRTAPSSTAAATVQTIVSRNIFVYQTLCHRQNLPIRTKPVLRGPGIRLSQRLGSAKTLLF